MARRLFGVPIALVSLVDSDRQWFKSNNGLAIHGVTVPETSRDISFCGHVVASQEPLHVPDATQDDRFADNPLVTGDPNVRFYAGAPLKIGSDSLGTLCVIDDKPRVFDGEDLKLLQDLAEMVEQELASLQLATTDHLTTLSNRRGFELLATHALRICRRLNNPATLLLFDLDRFKAINDLYGHAAGDSALSSFAQGLLAVFRESDVIGRLGGDEFAVMLNAMSSENVSSALDRLRAWIAANGVPPDSGYQLDFSVGRAEFDPAAEDTIEALLARADKAMYEDKLASRRQS